MEITIHCQESPLSASVPLYYLYNIVSDGSIDVQWWWGRPEEHDDRRAKRQATHILRRRSWNWGGKRTLIIDLMPRKTTKKTLSGCMHLNS